MCGSSCIVDCDCACELSAESAGHATGDVRATCVGHTGAITRLAFAPEAAGAHAGSGTQTSAHGAGARGAAPGPARLVSVDSHGGLRVWEVPRALLLPAAAGGAAGTCPSPSGA